MTKRKKNPTEAGDATEVRAVVDRIEDGDIAVLSLEDDTQLDVPRTRLPSDANSDGDHLLLKFDLDAGSGERTLKTIEAAPQARAAAEDRIRKMQERLARLGGAPDRKDFKL
ncbi:MAG TPA: DUF3006 domain-containing protein [Pyrinomonadaceae bacterium]|nr:DUF3006 domain-containing protein [Pyrinomonadaceae bacterium]